ncbi:MAG TPA: reverse transcriptase-like protein [Candidatus Saccharimonadales bacterium]|nr:reverse transcriptase-like protein [Candidatus Saccharimonadales bacterium]
MRHYFETYPIAVVTQYPLGDILRNKDANGRIIKCAIELGTYTLEFRSRQTVKSQALADFVAEWTDIQTPVPPECPEHWTMYFDGSLNLGGAGAGVYFISPSGDKIRYVLRIHFPASNNVAEYEAALHGLRIASELGVKRLMVYGDSALVINQVNKDWECSNENMNAYVAEIRKLEGKFFGIEFHHVIRSENQAADKLSKLGSSRAEVPAGVFVHDLVKPSITTDAQGPEVSDQQILVTDQSSDHQQDDWRLPFITYFNEAKVPDDKTEAEQLIRRSKKYLLVDGVLMRKNPRGEVLQKCVLPEEGKRILREVHAGMCGNHAASRTLVGKAFRAGFYWPTAVADAKKLVRHCEACQFFAKQIHVPAQDLQTIPSSWPFACWGLDMIGPFKPSTGGFRFVYVAIDKFSKWIEYKPLVKATAAKAAEFFNEISHRFGLPNCIITDLGSTFTGNQFWDFCEERCISVKYVSVAHPRANGQVERANGMILDALKKRLHAVVKKTPGKWIHELPAVVWGLRTQPSRNTGVSPYFMVFGAEAVIPADIAFKSPWVEHYDEAASNVAREDELDRLEEERLASCIRTARYLDSVRRYYNRNVHNRFFVVGDYVLRRIQNREELYKLSSPWEGPFKVKAVTRPGSYRLTDLKDVDIPNSWHIDHLIRFYP